MRKVLAVAACAVLWSAFAPSGAAAAEIRINPFFGCPGGTRVVPADSTVVLRFGWGATTRGLVNEFERAETTSLWINGLERRDADAVRYRTGPFQRPDFWVSFWEYPTGKTLGAGQSLSYTFDSVLSHKVHDGITVQPDGTGFAFAGPGSAVGGALSCTVVADGAPPTPPPAPVSIHPLFGCPGGVRFVPGNSEIGLRFGWGAATLGLVQSFLSAETTYLSLNGVVRQDADDPLYQDGPRQTEPLALTFWRYATGVTLRSGDSLTFAFDSVLSHGIHDGVVREPDGTGFAFAGPGSLFGGPLLCTVVAV